jgi:2-polyprenyl-3-methyl-5-hydroxy-6-metoxy-1,4-benzoquinol methylase
MSASPELIFNTIQSFQKSYIIEAAVNLELFTIISQGKTTISEISKEHGYSEKGLRVLLDSLVISGMLTKKDNHYFNTKESEMFLSKNSPAYMGDLLEFLFSEHLMTKWKTLTEAVKKGGAVSEEIVVPENPAWVIFAKKMAKLMYFPAQSLSEILDPKHDQKIKILDIAAGHGIFGITLAQKNPNAEIVALDWKSVLEVAKENAKNAGVINRYSVIEGDAFKVEYGSDYDFVLVTNFLHHFDFPTNVSFLKKVHNSLKKGGKVGIVEVIPEENRVEPPNCGLFSLTMLIATKGGDAYTFKELNQMLIEAGFHTIQFHRLQHLNSIIVAQK